MAALVQSYPQQAGTVTMFQARPNSAGAMIPPQPQATQHYGAVHPQQRGNGHVMMTGGNGPIVYRGATVPIQSYAYVAAPNFHPGAQWQQARTSRPLSTPAVPTLQSMDARQAASHGQYAASISLTNLPSTASMGMPPMGSSRDDSALPSLGQRRVSPGIRPHSAYNAGPGPHSLAPAAPTRSSPERYRRPGPRPMDSSNSSCGYGNVPQVSVPSIAQVGQVYSSRNVIDIKAGAQRIQYPTGRPNSIGGELPGATMDDMELSRGQLQGDMTRMRRRSMPALDSLDLIKPGSYPAAKQPAETARAGKMTPSRTVGKEPKPTHSVAHNVAADVGSSTQSSARTGSSGSQESNHSTASSSRPSSSANRKANTSAPTGNTALLLSPVEQSGSSQDYKLVNIPLRSSSSDAATANAKRSTHPSPLSKPVTMEAEAGSSILVQAGGVPPSPSRAVPPVARVESPAVKHLAAIREKGNKAKSKTSRLRRAFSFGSPAEFKKVVNPDAEDADDQAAQANPPSMLKLHKEPHPDDLYDAEQERIAQRQEAAGIGNSIYSGGKIFTGSTDNISISSTASSASIMIRKMGRGMKKGTRSLVGLFRPKSVIGVPAADAALPEASQATLSMVTAEAERELVNVNADPHSRSGGGTGFPHLERNSIVAAKGTAPASERNHCLDDNDLATRKSIIGGEKERAEVLAAVRKGILKTTNASPSATLRNDARAPMFELPQVPHVTDSPMSSAPSTPTEDAQGGHRRTGSVAIGSEDYFMSALRLRQDTKSAPGTPSGGAAKRNATFNPRLVFYDTWPSQEYDRRSEVATCNRLTPMLAQQIKEELNTFKMEMEVHENSKVYTHFF